MQDILKKLNIKDHRRVLLLQLPADLQVLAYAFVATGAHVANTPQTGETYDCLIGFATRQAEVDTMAAIAAEVIPGDNLVWIAYPKGTSMRYACEFNRDTGWSRLGELGFEPVRQIAIDNEWSALRFRRVTFIKKMTRSFAMTEEGKSKTGKNDAENQAT
jgi:hypothetical protein